MSAVSDNRALLDTNIAISLAQGKEYASRYRPYIEGKIVALSFASAGELLSPLAVRATLRGTSRTGERCCLATLCCSLISRCARSGPTSSLPFQEEPRGRITTCGLPLLHFAMDCP